MKGNNITKTEVFQPVTIEIILETAEELRGFGTICNYTPFTDGARAVGIDLTTLFDALPEGKYNAKTWDKDVASVAQALENHPALPTTQPTNEVTENVKESIMESSDEDYLEQLLNEFFAPMEEAVKEAAIGETADPVTTGITCKIVNVHRDVGEIEVSDGRKYKYNLRGCGEAINIKTMANISITEIPTSKYGTSKLQPADIEVIETVLSQIS